MTLTQQSLIGRWCWTAPFVLACACVGACTSPTAPDTNYKVLVSKQGLGSGIVTASLGGLSCGVTCAEASASFPESQKVTLTATPGVDSSFAGWGGACAGTIGTCEIVGSASGQYRALVTFNQISTGGEFFAIECTTAGERCVPRYQKVVSTQGILKLKYTAGAHCSTIVVSAFLDGAANGTGQTVPIGGGAEFDFGAVTAGTHTVEMEAVGLFDGCNNGTLARWSGTVAFTVN